MARLSRKERARREAISRGLKRYWRQVRQVSKAQHIAVKDARPVVRRVREQQAEQDISFRRALAAYIETAPRPSYVPPPGVQEIAFNLRDRDTEQGFQLWERFRGQTEVVTTVTW